MIKDNMPFIIYTIGSFFGLLYWCADMSNLMSIEYRMSTPKILISVLTYTILWPSILVMEVFLMLIKYYTKKDK